MSLQQDVIDAIGPGGADAKSLRGRISNVGTVELDCALNALLRARRIALSFGRFELIESSRALGTMPKTPVIEAAPPTAQEEAAASLKPQTSYCTGCHCRHPVEEFQQSTRGKVYEQCFKFRRGVISEAVKKSKGVPMETSERLPAAATSGGAQSEKAAAPVLPQPMTPSDASVIERMRQRQSAVSNQMQALQGEAEELERAIAVFKRFEQAAA